MIEAAAVTNIEEGKGLVEFGKALKVFDIQEQVISNLEEAAKLEITDTASDKVVRKHRQNAKSLLVKGDDTRKRLNREYSAKTNETWGLIKPRIESAYKKMDSKVRAFDEIRQQRKADKELADKLRAGKIQWHMDGLEADCQDGLEYNIPSDEIEISLETLLSIKLSSIDFGDRIGEAEQMLAKGIADTQAALENRVKFEDELVKTELIKKKQEAEAKRLDEERAKLEADRKAQEEATRKAAEAEAEIRRHEEEELRAEWEALEAEKERAQTVQNAFNIIPLTIKHNSENPEDLNEYFNFLSRLTGDESVFQDRLVEFHGFIANQLGFIVDIQHGHAISDHEQYKADLQAEIDQARADAMEDWRRSEKYKAEASAREKLIGPDRVMLKTIATDLEELLEAYEIPKLNTEEANALVLDLIASLKTRIYGFEQRGEALA